MPATRSAANVPAAGPLEYVHDAIPPSEVPGLRVEHTASTRVTLSWSAATDNLATSGALAYEVCVDSAAAAACTSRRVSTAPGLRAHTVVDLVPGEYRARVRAIDPASNVGPTTSYVTVRTAPTHAAHAFVGKSAFFGFLSGTGHVGGAGSRVRRVASISSARPRFGWRMSFSSQRSSGFS